MSHRLKRSTVWTSFKKVSDSLVTCTLCNKNFKFYGNTSNMRGHLKRKHFSYDCPALEEPLNENASTSTGFKSESTIAACVKDLNDAITGHEDEELNKMLVYMIVKDLNSAHIVDSGSFIKLINLLRPDYILPSSEKILKEMLPRMYNKVLAEVKLLVENAQHLAITTEIWQALGNEVFFTVTAHYLNSGSRKSSVLETVDFVDSYRFETFTSTLSYVLDKWKLTGKVVSVVSKNKADIHGESVLQLPKGYIPCFAFTLKDCISSAISASSTLTAVLHNCRNLVNHFVINPTAINQLKQVQKSLGMPDLKMKQEYPNKGNSRLKMLRRLLEIKEALNIIMPSLPVLIDSLDWLIIEDCVPLLEPFEEVAKELWREEYPAISLIIPLVKGLEYSLKKQMPKTETGIVLKDNLIKNIANNLGILESNPLVAKSTFLDPRFKKVAFSVGKNAEMAQAWVMEELEQIFSSQRQNIKEHSDENASLPTSTASSSVWEQFDLEVKQESAIPKAYEGVFLLIKHYLDLPFLHRTKDPVQFWESKKHSLPELYELSLRYLYIPGTSVPPTRLFSDDGEIFAERRSLLCNEMVNEMIFLNRNISDD